MMSENTSRRRQAKGARERNLARQERRRAQQERRPPGENGHAFFRRRFPAYKENSAVHRALAWLFSSRSPVAKLTGLVAIAVIAFFMSSYVFAGRIFPNVYAMDLPLGGLRPEAAEAAILDEWSAQIIIDITVDGELIRSVEPAALGMSLDAAAMAEAAKAAGLAGLPFGLAIEPIVKISHGQAQFLLLDLTEEIYEPQYEAGYMWSGGRLVTVPGRRGRHLSISQSLEDLKREASAIVASRRFELSTIILNPTVFDSAPFLEQAQAFFSNSIRLQAYDPFKDETVGLAVDEKQAAEWVTAGENGLSVRAEKFNAFIDSVNTQLVASGRYIDKLLAVDTLREALNASDRSDSNIHLRLNYLPQPYTVERGDTGYYIARKRGIPYELIRDANPTVQWGTLSIGDIVQIPSRDVMIPEDPVAHKRIIVDLESQWLVAYENNAIRFQWGISSGREEAPTYPGIFQILTHNDLSYGSSYALCNDQLTNCAHWDMFWFMGIYEVIPGLMNGFHGAVKLPNGNLIGGGNVWEPSTYGCIMSVDRLAKELYDWAEKGTMVEIVSEEFAPESNRARYALDYINNSVDTNWRYY